MSEKTKNIIAIMLIAFLIVYLGCILFLDDIEEMFRLMEYRRNLKEIAEAVGSLIPGGK